MMIPVYCTSCGQITKIASESPGQHQCSECFAEIQCSPGEDVFISYSTAQEDEAFKLGRKLHENGIRFWLAPKFIQHGGDFLEQIELALRQATIVLVLVSDESLKSPWVINEITYAVSNEIKIIPVFLGKISMPPGKGILFPSTQRIDADQVLTDETLQHVIDATNRLLGPAKVESFQAVHLNDKVVHSPMGVNQDAEVYVGPRPYPDGMEDYFYGRSNEINNIINKLKEHSIVLLTSPSGAGKSSLLSAGLVPIFRQHGDQVFPGIRVGRSLPDKYRDRLSEIHNVFTFSSIFGLGGLEEVPRLEMSIHEYLQAIPQRNPGRLRILLFDQFEEIFTQHRDCYKQRSEWVRQIVEAVQKDPDLRIVLAMRQEYYVDSTILFENVPIEFKPAQIQINRLKGKALTEVIEQPAARYVQYAPEVVEEILRQLRIIRIVQPDGSTVETPGEYVELCHLQIVCRKLWKSLPHGTKRIELKHLNEISQSVAGTQFSTFVKSALEIFYNDCVVEVANSRITESNGGFSPELIKFGCMKFVTRDGTRVPVQEYNSRTGRLPSWIVKQLVDRYLLRIESAGNERWYELSHDLLAETISREIDYRVDNLLYAAEMLENQLKKHKDTDHQGIDNLFPSLPDTLTACQPFQKQPGLFEDEAEFVLRISLATGIDLVAWSQRVQADHPGVMQHVLDCAMNCDDASVRSHVAEVSASISDDQTNERLLELICKDLSPKVRRSTAISILKLGRQEIFGDLIDSVQKAQGAEQLPFIRAISLLRAIADVKLDPEYEKCYRQLPMSIRTLVRTRAWGQRFYDCMPVLSGVFLPAALFSAVVAGLFKTLPAGFGYALAQDTPGVGKGLFHGIVAGVLWGGLIPTGLMLYRMVFWRCGQRASTLRPLGTLVAGLISGFISSCIVTASILGVYSSETLRTMGWVDTYDENRHGTLIFFKELFWTTRMGWSEMILGTALGLGFALVANRIKAKREFDDLVKEKQAMSKLQEVCDRIQELTGIVLPNAWPLILTQIPAIFMVWLIVIPGEHALVSSQWVFLSALGDAATQAVGAIAATIGSCFGLLIIYRGIYLEPRQEPL